MKTQHRENSRTLYSRDNYKNYSELKNKIKIKGTKDQRTISLWSNSELEDNGVISLRGKEKLFSIIKMISSVGKDDKGLCR